MNVDDTPVTQPVSYRLYCGLRPMVYTWSSVDISGTAYDLRAASLPDGIWYCAATASSTDGGESDYSSEIMLTINRKYPRPPAWGAR
jgi:hypothetical protein